MLFQIISSITSLDKIMSPMIVRQDKLKRYNQNDHILNSVLDELQATRKVLIDNVEKIIKQHPAYPWFSKIKGVGVEDIARVLAPIRVKPEYMCNNCGEVQDNNNCYICGNDKMNNLDYADTISSLWRYAGWALLPNGSIQSKQQRGESDYNQELKYSCWRLATSILRSGLRKKCSNCGELISDSKAKINSHNCSDAEFITVATSRYAQYYLDAKETEYNKVKSRGVKILDIKICNSCGTETTSHIRSCPSCKTKFYEDDSIIYESRINSRALRKMIKLFLAHLWIVWRMKLGLDVTSPYTYDKVGLSGYVDPWLMVDR